VVWTIYCACLFLTASTFAQLLPRRQVIGHLLASLIIANLVASLIFWFAPGVVTTWAGGISMEDEGVDVLRFPGFASEPNYWGSLLLVLFPMAWAAIMSRTVRRELGFGVAVAPPPLFPGPATTSNYTQLAVGVAGALAILFGLPGHRLGPVLTSILIAIGAALLVLTVQGYGDYILDKLTTYTTGTNSERYHAGLAAIRMWLEAPLFGFGLGSYPTHYQDFAEVQMLPVESAHSVLLATLAEQGIAGLAVLILLLIALLGVGEARIRLAWRLDTTARLLFLGLILYIGFLGITGNLYLYYFWFYAGLHHGLAIQAVKAARPVVIPQVARGMTPA
jgi:O-antigen ligase